MTTTSIQFEVEPPTDVLASLPPAVLLPETDLSASARAILVYAFSSPKKPSKALLMALAGVGSDTTWQKICRELEAKGWLIRRNHGSGGRGKWKHERCFCRIPRKNPLA
ncbi:MAG: hypothetical protein PHE17_20850 [Thiothrix sp.]|uniref:hypothetical protein n=1 Tax=Thiothrix sp. TaxID=1032 RepID=UPI00260C2560|nr:hypothetical protein [Thiothrix sp.]MDD5395480.1 hypothetical protein [Thiothrix sp.]